jgi:hypothetical protein
MEIFWAHAEKIVSEHRVTKVFPGNKFLGEIFVLQIKSVLNLTIQVFDYGWRFLAFGRSALPWS